MRTGGGRAGIARVLGALVLAVAGVLLPTAAAVADPGAPPADPGSGWRLESAEEVEDTAGAPRCDTGERWTWRGDAGEMTLLTVQCQRQGHADGMYEWLGSSGRVLTGAERFDERVVVADGYLVRTWVAVGSGAQGAVLAELRTPCETDPGRSGGSACDTASLAFARAVAAELPGGVTAARTPGQHVGHVVQALGVPLLVLLLVLGPVQLVMFMLRPRFGGRSSSPRYADISRQVTAARWRRRIRRTITGVLVLLVCAIAPSVVAARSVTALSGFAVIAVPLLLVLLVGYRTFLRPHPVERRRRRVVGTGAESAVGTALSLLAVALVVPVLAVAVLTSSYADMVDGWPATDAAAVARLDMPLLTGLLPLAVAFRNDPVAVPLVLGLPVLVLLGAVDALGQRLRNASVADALAQDMRPHYLYLRSFDEDRLRLPALLRVRGPLAAFALLRRVRFEEVLVRQLSETGPVIAIAPPGALLPAIGAARASFGNDEWQQHVARYAATARAVVVSATPSEVRAGFGWELDLIANRIPHRRIMVVLGPWRRSELQRRWRRFCEAVAHVPLLAPITMTWVPDGVHVLAHSERQGWRAWGATRRLDWTYAIAVAEATRAYVPDWSR